MPLISCKRTDYDNVDQQLLASIASNSVHPGLAHLAPYAGGKLRDHLLQSWFGVQRTFRQVEKGVDHAIVANDEAAAWCAAFQMLTVRSQMAAQVLPSRVWLRHTGGRSGV